MNQGDVETFRSCLAEGGLALFPADTVYGLATAPDSKAGVQRLYELKRRPPARPSAVMFFDLDRALAAVQLGARTRGALERLLPGPVTVVLPNPRRLFPLACAPRPENLGIRVPALTGALEPLAVVDRPVLQSSANLSGARDPRRIEDVSPEVRSGVDLELDAGVLPGTPSTVVDLSSYEEEGAFEVLREGAMPVTRIAAEL